MASGLNKRIDFFGVSDDRLIYDERKRRFVQSENMPAHLTRQYKTAVFKHVSPASDPAAATS